MKFVPLVSAIREARPLFDLLARHLQRAQPVGLFAAWDQDSWATDPGMLGQAAAVWEIGLPAAYGRQGAAVTLLFASSVPTMSDDQIRQVLASGYAWTRTPSTRSIAGGLVSGRVWQWRARWPRIASRVDEAPAQRVVRRAPARLPAIILSPAGRGLRLVDPQARALARLVDYAGQEKAAASMAVFENRMGGRVAVAATSPGVSCIA